MRKSEGADDFTLFFGYAKGRLMSHCRHESQRQKATQDLKESNTLERVREWEGDGGQRYEGLCFSVSRRFSNG